jgi:LmbE family N-acetylglucosaminyl deacetylase
MLKISKKESQVYFPNHDIKDLSLCSHLGVGAHQDDLEIMASHGILSCLDSKINNFVGVTVTNGSGSARQGIYKNVSDESMQKLRAKEQNESAQLGQYLGMLQLGFTSSEIKNKINPSLIDDLKNIIKNTKPDFIYTHNLADKHTTHVAVSVHLVQALRELGYKPQKFYGCEVWRSLDWLSDADKIPLEIKDPQLIAHLIECHKSQTEGGKRYDLATLGRLKANATYYESHNVDQMDNLWFAMDLMPLIEDIKIPLKDFIIQHIEKLKFEIVDAIDSITKKG